MFRELKCECCGAAFTTTSPRKKYCGDRCRTRMSEQFKRERPRKPRPKAEKKKEPHAEMIEIDRRAKEAGMTYGKYVAMKWSQEQAERRKKEREQQRKKEEKHKSGCRRNIK